MCSLTRFVCLHSQWQDSELYDSNRLGRAARAVVPAAAVVPRQQALDAAVVPSVTSSPGGRRSSRLHSASTSPEKKARLDLPSKETNVDDDRVVGHPATATLGSRKEAVEESSSAIEEESQDHVLVESFPALEEEAQDAEDHVGRRLRSRVGSLVKNYTEDPDDNEDPDDSDEGAKTPAKTLPVLQRLKKGRQMKSFSPQGSPCYHLVCCICLMSHKLSFSSYLRQ
jgi:hypothetical protein